MARTTSKKILDFTVMMASYNNEKYIGQAIESVLAQTYKNWELLIVDDCSLDNSVKIIKQYLDDDRIKLLVNKANLGYIGTLKRLVKESNSEILGILDGDDALKDDAVETMLDTYREHPDCGLIYSQFAYCDENLKFKSKGFCQPLPPGETNLHCNCISHFTTFKKECYYKTEGYDEDILFANDKDLTFKLEEVTNTFFADKILLNYRILPSSLGHDPAKALTRKTSLALAKYNAFLRRSKAKRTSNLSRFSLVKELGSVMFLLLKEGKYKKTKSFFSMTLNILNPLA